MLPVQRAQRVLLSQEQLGLSARPVPPADRLDPRVLLEERALPDPKVTLGLEAQRGQPEPPVQPQMLLDLQVLRV